MVILVLRADYLRVTHPFATKVQAPSFDLHVLGTPPAFILSQDQTLHKFYFINRLINSSYCKTNFKSRYFNLSLFRFQRPNTSFVLVYNNIMKNPCQHFCLLFLSCFIFSCFRGFLSLYFLSSMYIL